ncbi:MAG: hypothetical protein ACMUIP_13825, partial [bacterium]
GKTGSAIKEHQRLVRELEDMDIPAADRDRIIEGSWENIHDQDISIYNGGGEFPMPGNWFDTLPAGD